MTTVQALLHLIQLNEYSLQKQIDGITHDEALRQLPFEGNSLNWVVGHIVESRNYMLTLLEKPCVWSEEECRLYAPRSEPITGPESEHYHWETIVTAAEESLTRIRSRLQDRADEAFMVGEEPLGQQLMRLVWHEAYHIGQTEILRQLAEKADRVL